MKASTELVLYRDGQPVDLDALGAEHPSLLAALHASSRAIHSIAEEAASVEQQIEETEERLDLHEELGLSTTAVKGKRTRLKNRLRALEKRRQAHEMNYLEVPHMGGDPIKHADEAWFEGGRFHRSLPTDVPLDVLRALKHAKDTEVFDEFRVYTPASEGTDPMVVGLVDGAAFYVASWR